MSNFGKNIRKIRTFKNLSQTAFADIFGITRASVGAYEEGRAEAKTETMIAMANYFAISVDQLLKKELTINDISKFNQKEILLTNPVISKIQPANDFIHYISISNFEKYISSLLDPIFLAELPQFCIPESKDIARAFEHQGVEMLVNQHGIFQGDVLFCSSVKILLPANLKLNSVYVVVTLDSIFCRRLTSIANILTFSADNAGFADLEIRLGDISELWLVQSRFSTNLPAPLNIENRLNSLELEFQLLKKLVESKQ